MVPIRRVAGAAVLSILDVLPSARQLGGQTGTQPLGAPALETQREAPARLGEKTNQQPERWGLRRSESLSRRTAPNMVWHHRPVQSWTNCRNDVCKLGCPTYDEFKLG